MTLNDAVTAREAGILFNQGEWRHLIQSQSALFDPDELARISTGLEAEFREVHPITRKMPQIDPMHVVNKAWDLHLLKTGYDLPCLISADRQPKGRIVFCAQDPLRGTKSDVGITVGTFFGIDSKKLRQSRRHYGVCWHVVMEFVEQGYDVWLTDARKLFVFGGGLNAEHDEIMRQVLDAEIRAVGPVAVVAFGRAAQWSLTELTGPALISVLHPAARREKGWGHATLPDSRKHLSVFDARIHRYVHEIAQHITS